MYTTQHTGPETGFPVVALKPVHTVTLRCPFVETSGCSVYTDRPSSCRIYPLARAISRTRETGEITEHFARLKESHCLGHEQKKTQTVREWVEKQGLVPYNEQNDRLLEIISIKNRLKPGPLDLAFGRMFHLALYDLDTFRRKILRRWAFIRFYSGNSDVDTRKTGRHAVAADRICLDKIRTVKAPHRNQPGSLHHLVSVQK